MRPQKKRRLKRMVRKSKEDRTSAPAESQQSGNAKVNSKVRDTFKKRQDILLIVAGGCLLGIAVLGQIEQQSWSAGGVVIIMLALAFRFIIPAMSRRALMRCPKCDTELKKKWYSPPDDRWYRCPHCGVQLQ